MHDTTLTYTYHVFIVKEKRQNLANYETDNLLTSQITVSTNLRRVHVYIHGCIYLCLKLFTYVYNVCSEQPRPNTIKQPALLCWELVLLWLTTTSQHMPLSVYVCVFFVSLDKWGKVQRNWTSFSFVMVFSKSWDYCNFLPNLNTDPILSFLSNFSCHWRINVHVLLTCSAESTIAMAATWLCS